MWVNGEAAILFLGILFLAFCCGFIRSLRQYFGRNRQRNRTRAPLMPQHNLVISNISTTEYQRDRVRFENDVILNSAVFPAEVQISPPPYSAVSNTLPPSYDEATKQTNETNGHQTGTSTTQDENKF